MKDAELVRIACEAILQDIESNGFSVIGAHGQVVGAKELLARLESLAARLEGGVIVPREPTPAMLDAARIATVAAHISVEGKLDKPSAHERVLLAAAYRAMLTAQEASDD